MTTDDQVHPYAVVGGWAAYAIAKEWGQGMERLGRILLSRGQVEMGEEMLAAVAQLRMAGGARVRQHRAGIGSGARAGDGSSEVPRRPDGAGSGVPSGAGPGLLVREVAGSCGVSERQVVNWIHDEKLLATKHRGRWVIDEMSLALLLEEREIR